LVAAPLRLADNPALLDAAESGHPFCPFMCVTGTVSARPATGLRIAPKHEVSSSPASPLRADVLVALRRAVEAQHPKLPILPYMSPGATDSTHHHPIYCLFHFR